MTRVQSLRFFIKPNGKEQNDTRKNLKDSNKLFLLKGPNRHHKTN